MWPFNKNKKPESDIFDVMRDNVFNFTPESLKLSIKPNEVYGVLMEMGMSGSIVTIVAIAEGTVSMYIRGGSSVIGAGDHQAIREAGMNLIAGTQEHLHLMQSTQEHPVPDEGHMKFYALTPGSILTYDAVVDSIENDPIMPLFALGQDVITAIRVTTMAMGV